MSIKFAFLDSGTGGLPYMQYLKKNCPQASCFYLADTANFPYGTKSPEEVIKSAGACISTIIKNWNPDAIIIACNTISVTGLDVFRKQFSQIPIVGTVPAIKPAALISKKKIIGLLATQGAIQHPYIKKLQHDFANDCNVVLRGDTELVSFIEHNLVRASTEERLAAVRPAVDYFVSAGCDAIILGCTHFVHLANEIAQVAGPNVHVVDSREGVVRQALKVVKEHNATKKITDSEENQNDTKSVLDQALYVTGFKNDSDIAEYKELCSRLDIPWGGCISI